MKSVRTIKKGSALLLALVLFLSGGILAKVQAAVGIETDRMCSISFTLDGDLEGEFGELNSLTVPVKLYQVASVKDTGEYETLEGYEELKLESITSETTAAEWKEKAKTAAQIVADTKPEASVSGEIVNGQGKVEQIPTGMYLVAADTVLSDTYEYSFTPYLISLPNNYFGSTGNDAWVYDVTTGLKPGREERLGSLVIDKTLETYNATLGNATFVFQVEGVKDGEKVYSNVFSMVFDGAGTKSVVVEELPAGTQITVTEIYSGASYELTSEPSKTVSIIADQEVHGAFSNAYNGQMNGGSSVVNHFVNNEGVWDWQKEADSTGAQE